MGGLGIGIGIGQHLRPNFGSGPVTVPSNGPPPVAPLSPTWNGTAASGFAGTLPATVGRTTAKPLAQWWNADKECLDANQLVGLDARAWGGINYVDFYVEGTVQRVSSPSLQSLYGFTNLGYWINLDVATAIAAHNDGVINVYAIVQPNDVTMQARRLGPLTVRVNSVKYDHTYTIGATHGTYATIQAAVAAMISDGALRPRFQFVDSGSYEGQCTQNTYTSTTAYSRWEAVNGVTATIVRDNHLGHNFDPQNTQNDPVNLVFNWEWWPPVDQIEFAGVGTGVLQIDFLTFNLIHAIDVTRPYWFRKGSRCFNSIGTRDSNYWNGGPHPGMKFTDFGGTGVRVYFDGVRGDYLSGWMAERIANCQLFNQPGGSHEFSQFIANNYEYGSNADYYTQAFNVITMTGPAGYQVKCTVGNPSTFDVVNGSNVSQIGGPVNYLDKPPTGATSNVWSLQDMVDRINSVAGCSAAIVGGLPAQATTRAAWSTAQGGGAVYNLSATPSLITSTIDIHVEWFHFFTAGVENYTHINNLVRHSWYSTAFYYGEAVVKDVWVSGNCFDSDGNQQNANGHLAGSHCVFADNWHDGGWNYFGGNDSYSHQERNVFRGMFSNGGGPWDNSWFQHNIVPSVQGGVTIPGNNVVLGSEANVVATITNQATGDFRATGARLTNLMAKVDDYDGLNQPWAANDAPGPWAAATSAAPTYPT